MASDTETEPTIRGHLVVFSMHSEHEAQHEYPHNCPNFDESRPKTNKMLTTHCYKSNLKTYIGEFGVFVHNQIATTLTTASWFSLRLLLNNFIGQLTFIQLRQLQAIMQLDI